MAQYQCIFSKMHLLNNAYFNERSITVIQDIIFALTQI